MLINQQNLPLVAMEFMNEVHFEDVALLNELYELILEYEKTPNKDNRYKINAKYMQWCNHTILHFKGEEEEMLKKGFPVYMIHKEEHENALKSMNEVFEKWQNDEKIEYLKEYVCEFTPKWLVNHIQTMDTVTAFFLKTGQSLCSMG
ncbi:hypothetical protein CRV08_14685 [Halarcobacter ebronensis]|uniref:Hemerythrin-like domain-containing protein n=1 Tax=Halarcobacter ebronensis TaxID=1462615 RepID=A0A4Q0Y6Z4_9BACT|nr:hemerythrin family protein [Halarcobacter ebronensis]RXJ65613.1 hypothetical protein CRV08_14685 [Halarcobacter ebronensis]